jgi:CheY-like chemotaxis protein/two-component sensor histidine kinase
LEHEKVARQEAERVSRLKDEFVATMSHELRTPLTSILGWSQLLRSGTLSAEKQAQAAEAIYRNAALETQLVDDILDASRIISGTVQLQFELLDVKKLLESLLESLRPVADAREIQVTAQLAEVSKVWAHPERLQQVFWNLLSNAVKFTSPGGTISIRLAQEDSSLTIEVADTGAGISPDFIPHVFERFRQEDSTITRKHGGLGLGLAIVRHLVELHGGIVFAESPGLGKGATFTVRLPVADPKRAEARPKIQIQGKTVRPDILQGIRALIVEDDADARELIAEVMRSHGAEVVSADSYASTMELLKGGTKPDVYLVDIGMADRNGYALIAAIRRIPEFFKTPALAVTAYATESDRAAALAAGFHAHVPKPFDPTDLVWQVSKLAKK